MAMLPLLRALEYLRSNGAPFVVASFPAPEAAPEVAHAVHHPRGAMFVDTHILVVDGRPAIACVPHGQGMNLLGLRARLGAELIAEGGPDQLVWRTEDRRTDEEGRTGWRAPPLGGLLGASVFVDASLLVAPVIEFVAFAPTDFVQISFEDFARIEQPRIEEFAGAGELAAPSVH